MMLGNQCQFCGNHVSESYCLSAHELYCAKFIISEKNRQGSEIRLSLGLGAIATPKEVINKIKKIMEEKP